MSTNAKVAQSTTSHKTRTGAFTIFGLIILITNAALTFLFGYTFCGDALGSAFLGGAMCALFFDLAALAWYTARRHRGLSSEQRALANALSILTIVSSTLVSVIWVMMSIRLVDLTDWHDPIGIFGVGLVTLLAAANFIGLFAFQYFSPEERDLQQEEELRARADSHRQEVIAEVHERTMIRTNDLLMGKVPQLADRQADAITREYLSSFDSLDLLDDPEPAPTPPPMPPVGADAGASEAELLSPPEEIQEENDRPGKL